MAKLTIGQKAERLLKLLLGLRNPRVVEALRHFGFSDADLEQGWRLLKALTDGRLSVRPPSRQDPTLLARLDDWENRWFPIASATLRGRFPNAHGFLFLNLSQTEGAEVVLSTGTFVQRVNKLASEPSLGAEGAEARALLEQRGLTAATLSEASAMIELLGTVAPASAPLNIDPAQQAQAETAMWNWYLEWSEIARVAVRDRRMLRELGFLSARRPVADEVVEEEAPLD